MSREVRIIVGLVLFAANCFVAGFIYGRHVEHSQARPLIEAAKRLVAVHDSLEAAGMGDLEVRHHYWKVPAAQFSEVPR